MEVIHGQICESKMTNNCLKGNASLEKRGKERMRGSGKSFMILSFEPFCLRIQLSHRSVGRSAAEESWFVLL
jgi:hypothetical protein